MSQWHELSRAELLRLFVGSKKPQNHSWLLELVVQLLRRAGMSFLAVTAEVSRRANHHGKGLLCRNGTLNRRHPPPSPVFMGVDVKIGVGLSEQFAPENAPVSLYILPKPKLFRRHILGHGTHAACRAKHVNIPREPHCVGLPWTAPRLPLREWTKGAEWAELNSRGFFFCHCYDSRWKFSL